MWPSLMKRPLLTAIVVGLLAFPSAASAVATQIQVDDDFYAPANPPVRNLSSGASFQWQRASGAGTSAQRPPGLHALQLGRPDERADQLLDQGLRGHLPLLLHAARHAR